MLDSLAGPRGGQAATTAARRRVTRRAGRDERALAACTALVGLYLLATLALPLYVLLSKSFEDRQGAFVGLANYATYFSTPALFNSVYNSLTVATISTG